MDTSTTLGVLKKASASSVSWRPAAFLALAAGAGAESLTGTEAAGMGAGARAGSATLAGGGVLATWTAGAGTGLVGISALGPDSAQMPIPISTTAEIAAPMISPVRDFAGG